MSKRGENITKRKDGRWEARVLKGYNQDGRAIYKSLYKDGTKTVPLVESESSSVGSDTNCFGPPKTSIYAGFMYKYSFLFA